MNSSKKYFKRALLALMLATVAAVSLLSCFLVPVDHDRGWHHDRDWDRDHGDFDHDGGLR